MSDFISRQALCEYALNQKDKSVTPNDIMRFPSAHPELDEWCTDCKEYDKKRHCCPRFNRVIRETLAEVRETKTAIRCKDCKWCEDANGLMCKNPASWVVATGCDFGCVLAERRTDG